MLPYLIVIFIFSVLIHFSDRFKNHGNYVLYYLVTFIGLIIISIFSGVRHLEVGIDIKTYAEDIFESVVLYGTEDTISLYSRWADPGYVYLNYIISLFTKNIHVVLGSITFFIQLNLVIFFRKYQSEISPAFSMFLWNLLILALSFSMIRQTLAISIVVWVYYFLINRKYTYAILIGLVSLLFHKSSILFILIIIGLFFYAKIEEKLKESRLLSLTLLITIILGIILNSYPDIVTFILGDLTISNIQQQNYGSIPRLILFVTPIIYFRILNKERFILENKDYYLYLICLVVISFSWLSGINYSISRFTHYFYPIYIIFLSIQLRRYNKLFSYLLLGLWGIIVFWWLIVRVNEGGVIPYVPYWMTYIQ